MPYIDCLKIEIDRLHEQGTLEAAIKTEAWQKMKSRLKNSPHFEYCEEFEEMYEILYRHLKFYYFPRILGEEFVFAQFILASRVWDYPLKYQIYKEDKQEFIKWLDLETEEDCLKNDALYEESYRSYGYRSMVDCYWIRPPSNVVHFRSRLSDNIPVGISYWFYNDEIGYERTSKIECMIKRIQTECVGCNCNQLLEAAPTVAKRLLGTTPILGEEGDYLVNLTYEWLCAQSQFAYKIQHITDDLSAYSIDEFIDVFYRLASSYEKLDSAHDDFLLSYHRTVRAIINSPEECVKLAHKYILSFSPFEVWEGSGIDGIAIFANGTCVEVIDSDYPDVDFLEDRAKCVLRDNYESIDLFEYDPICADEESYSENNEHVYGACAKGGFSMFYWLGCEELDDEIVNDHFKKDYKDLVVHSIITRETLGSQ